MQFWHSCWNHCQKFEQSLLIVRNCVKNYICSKHWFFIKIFKCRHVECNFRTPLYENFPPEVPKPLTGCARLTMLKLFFQKKFSKTSATQVNAVSLTPPFFFDQNSINLKNWNFFRKVLIPKFFFWAVQTNPPKIHAKIRKIPVQNREKIRNYKLFKKSIFSKCFFRHVECSIGSPHPHTHTNTHTKTFFARRTKISLWKSETKDKINSFQKVFVLKNFTWTNKLQSGQPHPFFLSNARKFSSKTPTSRKKLRFLLKGIFLPKSFCWTRKGRFDNLSETLLPKSGNFFFQSPRMLWHSKYLKKVKKYFWKRRVQFWKPFFETSTGTPGIIAQSTKVTKTFLKKSAFAEMVLLVA